MSYCVAGVTCIFNILDNFLSQNCNTVPAVDSFILKKEQNLLA